MSDDKDPPKPSISALDSPSSYLTASKQDKKAIAAAYSEIFRIPKKKRKSTADEEGKEGDEATSPSVKKKRSSPARAKSPRKSSPRAKVKESPKRKSPGGRRGVKTEVPSPEHARPTTASSSKVDSPTKTNDDDPSSILRKGDLVRLDSS